MLEQLEEKAMVQFLSKTVDFKSPIPVGDQLNSTSIALGEAYMDGQLEIEGNLYHALDHFLGQMGKFSTDEKALKKLIHTSVSKKNQEKEVTPAETVSERRDDASGYWMLMGISAD